MSERPEDILTLATMKAEMDQLREEVRAQTTATKELVDAWKAAGKVVQFVKWVSQLIAALTAIWLFLKHGIKP